MFDECLGLIVITKHARNGLLWESGDIIDIFRRLVSTIGPMWHISIKWGPANPIERGQNWVSHIRLNSLAPGRRGGHFQSVISEHLIRIRKFMSTSCETALKWMSQNNFDDKSTLVQVIAWCCQATSHYLSQCWPRSISPHDVTRPQWVNLRTAAIYHEISLPIWVSNMGPALKAYDTISQKMEAVWLDVKIFIMRWNLTLFGRTGTPFNFVQKIVTFRQAVSRFREICH